MPDRDIEHLLKMPLGLDVWEWPWGSGRAGGGSSRRPDHRVGAPHGVRGADCSCVDDFVSTFAPRSETEANGH
jgi:hypothetical protein